MSTLRQLIHLKNVYIFKKNKKSVRGLNYCPQRRGLCLKVCTETPKKPNSGKRQIVKLKMTHGKIVRAKVPGEGPSNLRRFSRVLIRGGRVRDLVGIKFTVIRGKLDCIGVINRKSSLSKYGLKRSVVFSIKKH